MIPKHVAIIMDGNGRWAKARGRPRVFGHIRGSSRIKSIVEGASDLGIRALTLYAFSTENWTRPDTELTVLWKLLKKYLIKEVKNLEANNVRLKVIGEIDKLAPELQTLVKSSEACLAKNTGLFLTFCVSYGSQREIVDATKRIVNDVISGKLMATEINEALFENYLWTDFLGDLAKVDLLIRTSGEQRISNYLLWQAAYAEFLFMDVLWPDFSKENLSQAVNDFSKRQRRFGGI
ncbi:MAG: isoprenyl transferase [Xanthomonadaceae bacterium]|nr:isoprenyl transferase [Xanthomonadaceae bacterium]